MKSTEVVKIDKLLAEDLSLKASIKTLKDQGYLAWEYNPFKNYRITEEVLFKFEGKYYSKEDLKSELLRINPQLKNYKDEIDLFFENIEQYKVWELEIGQDQVINIIPEGYSEPELLERGQLADFDTEELQFSLNNPINVLPQYSYDGSVNLIINDGKNKPKLINSRFSPTGRNTYKIVDRTGDNDTNIYDRGEQFEIDTSLYKLTNTIPKITFLGMTNTGILPVGNYHFYFRYEDADGNQTDFIGESGLVSVFIGNSPQNIHSGFVDQNSHKGCRFTLTNLESAYSYISVYYTRESSDINQSRVVQACKIEQKFLISNSNTCNIVITGYADTTEVAIEDINPTYQVVQDAQTQDACQNMLFLANVHKVDIPYKDLQDISLRIVPQVSIEEDINYEEEVSPTYSLKINSHSYYEPKTIYNKVGYFPNEIYRFGIVYILSDNTLTPVFNIRGNKGNTDFSEHSFYDENDERNYISYNEETFQIIRYNSEETSGNSEEYLEKDENAKGVFFTESDIEQYANHPLCITFQLQNYEDAINYLKKLKIKGFFIVRQKRIPTILCQGLTIGVDKESHLPAIPDVANDSGNTEYLIEKLLDENRVITHNLTLETLSSTSCITGILCPDFDVNIPYYNTIFNGDSYVIEGTASVKIQNDPYNLRHFYTNYNVPATSQSEEYRIIAVEDNTKLMGIGNSLFSARAGEAEEGFRYEYIGYENKTTKATNIARGCFGPFLGVDSTQIVHQNEIVNIRIPGYSKNNLDDYFTIRYNDKSPFFAISDRISISELDSKVQEEDQDKVSIQSCYRGDCYICRFTHRVNRNFQDPSAPTNDKIVDGDCWKDHYSVKDGVVQVEKFDDINLGDLNAKRMGLWVTFTVRSSNNLSIRALDASIPDEQALFGHPRGFYPYYGLLTQGAYKIPEALCYNDGFSSGLSQRYNYELPDVPYIKNEFSNRILYSDLFVNDSFTNGFRTFRGEHFRDYPQTYGSITKIIEFRGNIICVFEHGIANIPVNERAVAGEGAGGFAYINTSNVLPENPKVISDTFGSQWRESVIKTPTGVYGVDTVGKKIWKTDGQNFWILSDFTVQKFLNDNISLEERELTPIIGVRNVKTHYNRFKQDIMFTFYDNLEGFEEKVWNLCYNELFQKWITFYSWVPSYSENIDNVYFSFDRNTSKWIAKLGTSHADNAFSDGVTLTENVFDGDSLLIGTLGIANRELPEGVKYKVYYTLEHDCLGNYKRFKIEYTQVSKTENGDIIYQPVTISSVDDLKDYDNLQAELFLTDPLEKYITDIYYREYNGKPYTPTTYDTVTDQNKPNWYSLDIYVDEYGVRKELPKEEQENEDSLVYLLNIKAEIQIYDEEIKDPETKKYLQSYKHGIAINAGYFESVVAVTPRDNLQLLTTDFWKHGQAGLIDITDPIRPTYWYGKQHPFEYEFVVVDNPAVHKLFDNLEIIGNNAKPDSFHYEIVGDCFDFSEDKKNAYVRQEITKDFYQYNGSNITYNKNLFRVSTEQQPKSTIFPLYYTRQDTYNEVEDFYKSVTAFGKDYTNLSGTEVTYYPDQDEFRLWEHAKAADIDDVGRLRGNMNYQEDKWKIQINPIEIVQKVENEWKNGKVPITIYNLPIPGDVEFTEEEARDLLPKDLKDDGYNGNDIDATSWEVFTYKKKEEIGENTGEYKEVTYYATAKSRKEVKLKDKYIKIRVRYTGDKLAIIRALKTIYRISYA